jgi:hypothetical protein
MCKCRATSAAARQAAERTQAAIPGPQPITSTPSAPVHQPLPAQLPHVVSAPRTAPVSRPAPTQVPRPAPVHAARPIQVPAPRVAATHQPAPVRATPINRQAYVASNGRVYLDHWGRPIINNARAVQAPAPAPTPAPVTRVVPQPATHAPVQAPFIREATRTLAVARTPITHPQLKTFLNIYAHY